MKRLFICMALIAAFTLGACSDAGVQANAEEETVEAFSFTWVSNSGFYGCTYALVDNETGVNYIVVERNSKYGEGVSITPRFNADGTLYVSEVG